ncbi:MAG: glycosyltransferase family 9 protein [Candidatus Omnitrophota bacterium]|jgi:lipopolysaccharide heptosyltransferase II
MRKNILVINPFGIGDVLFSTPLVSSIRKAYPDCYIAYICNLKTRDILTTNPAINEVIVFERDEYRNLWKKSKRAAIKKFLGFWKEIKKRKFDIVFDLSLGKEYAFFCWRSGIKDRRGFDYKGRGRFLNHKIAFDGFNDKPVAEYYLDLLGSRLSAYGGSLEQYSSSGVLSEAKDEVEKHKTVLITTDEDKAFVDNFLTRSGIKNGDILVGIAPGGGMSFGKEKQGRRRWPAGKFAELSDRIIEKYNVKLVLIWGPGEEGLIKEITDKMKTKPVIAPKTTIRETAALMKKCKLVVSNDGGMLQIAVSQGIPTISIYGPTDAKVYGPYPKSEKNIVITSDIDCRPCYKKFKLPECDNKKCLEDISVDEVFKNIKIGE